MTILVEENRPETMTIFHFYLLYFLHETNHESLLKPTECSPYPVVHGIIGVMVSEIISGKYNDVEAFGDFNEILIFMVKHKCPLT